MTIEDLDKICDKCEELAQRAREDLRSGKASGGDAGLISNGIKSPAAHKRRTKRLGPRRRNGAQ